MTFGREHVPTFLSLVLGKPVRWSAFASPQGPFDGAAHTLDVFAAPAEEQRELNRRAWKHRDALRAAAGGPVLLVFHEGAGLHSEVRNARFVRGITMATVPLDDSPLSFRGLSMSLDERAA